MLDLNTYVRQRLSRDVPLIGRKIGMLTVVAEAGTNSSGNILYHCVCECGGASTPTGSGLRKGQTLSCGCLLKHSRTTRNRKHGRSKTKEYAIWKTMRQRCLNPANGDYPLYGGRGITVCDEWSDFERFFADIGPIPKGQTLDRVDNNKGYSKDNCRLVPNRIQSLNKRSNFVITFDGISKPLSVWAEETGIGHTTISRRIKSGWEIEKALTIQPKIGGQYGQRQFLHTADGSFASRARAGITGEGQNSPL